MIIWLAVKWTLQTFFVQHHQGVQKLGAWLRSILDKMLDFLNWVCVSLNVLHHANGKLSEKDNVQDQP